MSGTTLLKKFIQKKHVSFYESFDSWEEAVRASYKPLIMDGTVDTCYVEQVIDSIKTLGPYIVIAPDIAIPHTTMKARGVHKTDISFMKVEKPVSFTKGSSDDDARLFFSLAAENPEKHLDNMQQLAEMLLLEGLTDELLKCCCMEELSELAEKFEMA